MEEGRRRGGRGVEGGPDFCSGGGGGVWWRWWSNYYARGGASLYMQVIKGAAQDNEVV